MRALTIIGLVISAVVLAAAAPIPFGYFDPANQSYGGSVQPQHALINDATGNQITNDATGNGVTNQ